MRIPAVIIAISIFSVLGACNKSSLVSSGSYPDSLFGKWNYVEYYASSGGPGSWYAVTPANQWLELRQDGTVSSNIESFKNAGSYQLPDSGKIKFLIPSKPEGLLFQYSIDTIAARLILSPLNPLCIEGCALKFKR